MKPNDKPEKTNEHTHPNEMSGTGTTAGLFITLFNLVIGAFNLKVLILISPTTTSELSWQDRAVHL